LYNGTGTTLGFLTSLMKQPDTQPVKQTFRNLPIRPKIPGLQTQEEQHETHAWGAIRTVRWQAESYST